MKKSFVIILVIIAIAAVAFFVFKPRAASQPIAVPETATPATDATYSIPAGTTVSWQGKRPLIQGYMDSGTIAITDGAVAVAGNTITANATFDMNTITATATGMGRGADMLTNHLKSADFFEVERYPTATLTITDAQESGKGTNVYTATGTLTIKDITRDITFPVAVYDESNALRVVVTIPLDRTQWNIRYGSDKFFSDLGEKMIADMFTVSVDLTLQK